MKTNKFIFSLLGLTTITAAILTPSTINAATVETNVPEILITKNYPIDTKLSKVSVYAVVKDDTDVGKVRYLSGKQTIDAFKNGQGIEVYDKDKNPAFSSNFNSSNAYKSNNIVGFTFDSYSNGFYTIYSEDIYGNASIKVVEVKEFDSTPPLIILENVKLNTSNNETDIVFTTVDGNSNLKSVKYSYGKLTAAQMRNLEDNIYTYDINNRYSYFIDYTVTVKENGTYTLYVSDTQGNETIKYVEVDGLNTLPVDNTSPVVNITSNLVNKLNAYELKVNINSTDLSGIKEVKYKKSTDTNYTILTASTSNEIILTSNGVYTFVVTDNFNNVTTKTLNVNEIETNPLVSVPALKTYFTKIEWIERNGTISLSLTPKLDGPLITNSSETMVNAFTLIEKLYVKDYRWNNQSQSIYDQYVCHVYFAGADKTPWNLEPQRQVVSGLSMILNSCNPPIDTTIPTINKDTYIFDKTKLLFNTVS